MTEQEKLEAELFVAEKVFAQIDQAKEPDFVFEVLNDLFKDLLEAHRLDDNQPLKTFVQYYIR